MAAELKPWGRFKLVSKEPADESDHIYFYKSISKIGRNPTRADIVLDMLFVSGVHCVVMLESVSPTGEATVRIQDMSRNGIYVNEERVGKSNVATIKSNFTVHFTKPGLVTKNISPTVYKFEILKSGLTPENNQLRAERDRASAKPPTAAGLTTPAKSASVMMTLQLSGRKHPRSDDEEMEIETTRTISVISEYPTPSPASSKRHRTGDRDEDADLLTTTAQLQKSNQSLRQKLKEYSDREVNLKQSLSQVEREVDTLKDQLDVIEERKKQVEDDLTQKEERLADREREVDRVKDENQSLQSMIEKLKADVESARTEAIKQAQANDELKAEREKLDTEMTSMTSQLGAHQAKIRQQDEYIKSLLTEKRKTELAMDSAQTRTEQIEEGKRGVAEDNTVLRSRFKAVENIAKDFAKVLARLNRSIVLDEDHSIIAQELEELQRHSDNSILSSEQSQPAPAQDNYCADTQPEEGDYEQTLDQEAALANAGPIRDNIGPFASNLSKIAMDPSSEAHLLDLDHQQPLSTDLSADDTPAYTESKSSLESTFSSGSSSKTPPAPPLPRPRAFAPRLELTEEVEETKEEGSEEEKADAEGEASGDDEKEQGKEAADKEDVDETVLPEDDERADDEDDETALQEEEDETALPDEEVENDKENTPVKEAVAVSSPASTATTAAADNTVKPQPGGWLQQIVNSEDKSEQVSASEGGGIFDDETQLSDG